MKLALGTAQFGLDYGVSNRMGKVAPDDVRAILDFAKNSGITMLDTAAAYGECEKVLGEVGVQDFDIVTKVPSIPSDVTNIASWIENSIRKSMSALGIEKLAAVLLHRPMQLLEKDGRAVYDTIQSLKIRGVIGKVGISIYQPPELDALFSKFRFDLVQAPLNVFDRRLISSGWLSELIKRGVEVHVRSIFLQGLLLMSARERPSRFLPWSDQFEHYRRWLAAEKLSAVQACVGFVYQQEGIDRIIVGVQSRRQLQDIVDATEEAVFTAPDQMEVRDPALINPFCWDI